MMNADVSKLTKELQCAIFAGNVSVAQNLVKQLAELRTKLQIKQLPGNIPQSENKIWIQVYIEDCLLSGASVKLQVRPTDTILQMKNKMLLEYDIATHIQKWIIGDRIRRDDETLQQSGVSSSHSTIFLYLMSPKSVSLTREKHEEHKQSVKRAQESSVNVSNNATSSSKTVLSADTLKSEIPLKHEVTTTLEENATLVSSSDVQNGWSCSTCTYINQSSTDTCEQCLNRCPRSEVATDPHNDLPKDVEGENPGWACPACTFVNEPTRPGCVQCTMDRPVEYVVPDSVAISQSEADRLAREAQDAEEMKLVQEQERLLNFNEIISYEQKSIVPNREDFECPICMIEIAEGEGVMLRNCLHCFCKECLSETVLHSEDADIQCPYTDHNYSCQQFIPEREIKALVNAEIYEKFLCKSLSAAEGSEVNSFHCKTVDCIGWCVYEDEVNFFNCPVCQKKNCLTCKAIHEGMNCKEYQDDMKIKALNDDAAKKTQEMLDNLLKSRDAMKCPKCEIILQKKDGCDWLRCSCCKTEICWVTRGPRWGPKGNGDTSGGCRCRMGGRSCHPNCMNCH